MHLSEQVTDGALYVKFCNQFKIVIFIFVQQISQQLEWKRCGKSSDADSLALANSLLFHWLGENLMRLKEKKLLETVSAKIFQWLSGFVSNDTEKVR